MEKTVIRSNRKTLGLEIGPQGLIVRAPRRMSDAQIEAFLESRQDWIRVHTEKYAARQAAVSGVEKFSPEGLQALVRAAKAEIPRRVAYYAPIVGVDYGRISIRCQRSRWGSCSSKGNLNFNCLLMLMPEEIRDYVVVHELCHRLEMNHSAAFWAQVERVLPDYRDRRKWLRDNGDTYMRRMTG